jgi:hypothetical protein
MKAGYNTSAVGLIRALGVYLPGKVEETRDGMASLQKFRMAEEKDEYYLSNTLKSR